MVEVPENIRVFDKDRGHPRSLFVLGFRRVWDDIERVRIADFPPLLPDEGEDAVIDILDLTLDQRGDVNQGSHCLAVVGVLITLKIADIFSPEAVIGFNDGVFEPIPLALFDEFLLLALQVSRS